MPPLTAHAAEPSWPGPWRRAGRAVASIAGILVVTWLASFAAVVVRGRRDQARPVDAIVVLGAAQYAGRPSPVLRARLDHAIALYRRGIAPRLIVTGGTGDGDTTSEAAVSRRYAVKRGVPSRAILLETQGRTTSESMEGVADILRQHRLQRVVLVSDPFHMLRLDILARRHGVVAYTSPTRTSPIARNAIEAWRYVLGESVKVPAAIVLTELDVRR